MEGELNRGVSSQVTMSPGLASDQRGPHYRIIVGNNPVNYVDLYGLLPEDWPAMSYWSDPGLPRSENRAGSLWSDAWDLIRGLSDRVIHPRRSDECYSDCMKEFFVCMGENLLLPGASTLSQDSGRLAGGYYLYKANARIFAAKLTVPLRSSIVRGFLERGAIARATAAPFAVWGTVILSEGYCIWKELQCLSSL